MHAGIHPPGCGPGDPPGVGLEIPPRCGLGRPDLQLPPSFAGGNKVTNCVQVDFVKHFCYYFTPYVSLLHTLNVLQRVFFH